MKSLFFIYVLPLLITPMASHAVAENNGFFEKNLSKVGESLDQAKAKGEELGNKAKKEVNEAIEQAKKESTEAKKKVEETVEKDWSVRLKGAFEELKTGVQRAWTRLKGNHDNT